MKRDPFTLKRDPAISNILVNCKKRKCHRWSTYTWDDPNDGSSMSRVCLDCGKMETVKC